MTYNVSSGTLNPTIPYHRGYSAFSSTGCKLQYFGHITQGSAGQLALTVLEGIMEGLRHQGRLRDSGYTTLKSGLAANTFS